MEGRRKRRRFGWGLIALTAVGVALGLGYWIGRFFVPPRGLPRVLDDLIRGGIVVDGTGRPGFRADVGVARGRIVWVGRWRDGWSRFVRVGRVVDVTGRVVSPGWIDVHTHIEGNVPQEGPFRAPNFIGQGVTTIITGNCGRSFRDIPAFFRQIRRWGAQVNVATFIGHNTLREEVLRDADRPATPSEIAAMQESIRKAMEAGALGLSTGLAYRPGMFATPEEVVLLVKTIRPYGGVYATHIRDEGAGSREALEEAVDTALRAGVPLHICHFKLSGRVHWGQAAARLQWIEALRQRGWRITLDVYPYRASSTSLEILLPPALVQDRAFRHRPTEEIVQALIEQARRNGWTDFSFARVAYFWPDHSIEGLTLPEVAVRWGLANPHPGDIRSQALAIARMLRRGGAQMIYEDMSEGDVQRVLQDPWAMVGSDSAVRTEGLGRPHPRGWGTFPRLLGTYVRDLRLLPLEVAIHRVTDLPARIFCLEHRGRIAPGYWADIVVFRPQAIRDRATYEDPWARPTGIDFVWVNGVPVLAWGRETGQFPGLPVPRRCRPADTDTGVPRGRPTPAPVSP